MKETWYLIKKETLPFGKRWSKRTNLRDVLEMQIYNILPNFQIL